MTATMMDRTGYRVTLGRVVHSEWTKVRSLRSTWIVLGVVAPLAVGIAGAIGWNANREPGYVPTVADAVGGAFLGVDLISLVIGVFGVLLVTGEYSSGLIRATLAAVPRRVPVLPAKALAFAAVAAPVTLAICVTSLLVNQAFTGAADRITLGDPEVLRAIAGAAAAPIIAGLLGMGIGAMVRHTAGAITAYVAVLLVVPALLPAVLTDPVQEKVLPYLPTAATQALYAVGESNPLRMFSPGVSALVLAGWVVLALAGGAAVLHRWDA